MCVYLLSSGVSASQNISETQGINSEHETSAEMTDLEKVIAGVASVEDLFGTIDSDTVPEAVGFENAKSKNHIERLYSAETDLNTVIFRNIDGSKTMYIYDYPVKYQSSKSNRRI